MKKSHPLVKATVRKISYGNRFDNRRKSIMKTKPKNMIESLGLALYFLIDPSAFSFTHCFFCQGVKIPDPKCCCELKHHTHVFIAETQFGLFILGKEYRLPIPTMPQRRTSLVASIKSM